MAAEQVLGLLDSFWFETTILSIKTPLTFHPKVDPISQTKVEEVLPLDKKLLPAPTLEIRSHSDQNLGTTSCFLCDSPPQYKLRTIPSGREIRDFSKGSSCENYEKEGINTRIKQRHGHGRRGSTSNKGKNTSRSLTELEFKELKGFMDLGFVFSEEDKNSGLVSLIPGLHRLGSREDAGEGDDDDEEQEENIDETVISDHKPYLSEAWDVLYRRRGRRNPLLDWRVPDSGSEIDMKHSLRFWAHSVASIVR
ncbi:uncharacterized protein LOC130745259 [Lotus japonicus]|uniref:uncharacterized protein LOC130745259 n=1 Tax=Lotus japonicus TaxID=34305 RepID=UPI00258520D2|nr:uncharacterized protein LOC130745259 [Lotus japonicus]